MIQDYMVFLFESDLAFLGIITLILLRVTLLTVSRSDVIPVCKLYLRRSLVTWRVPTQHALSPRLLSNFAWNALSLLTSNQSFFSLHSVDCALKLPLSLSLDLKLAMSTITIKIFKNPFAKMPKIFIFLLNCLSCHTRYPFFFYTQIKRHICSVNYI